MKEKIFYLWMRTVLWCGFIYLFSSIPNTDPIPLNLETIQGITKFLSRKIAHLAEYGVLLVFFWRAFERSFPQYKRHHFLISFAFILLFSISDEWHQSFIFGRSASEFDVWIDSVGAILGYAWLQQKDEKKILA